MKLEGILALKNLKPLAYHEFILARACVALCRKFGVELFLIHIHSHSGMWINEIADNLLKKHSLALPHFVDEPVRLVATVRHPNRTKADVKRIYEADESAFWQVLTVHHDSLAGHIRQVFALSRKKIKMGFLRS